MLLLNLLVLLSASILVTANAALYENDVCITHDNLPGKCVVDKTCTEYITKCENGQMSPYDMKHCGFNIFDELICCPTEENNTIRTTTPTTTIMPVIRQRVGQITRLSEEACAYYKSFFPTTLQSLRNTSENVLLGDFPHIAAIGYSNTSDPLSNDYVYICHGSLIHPKYILTSAHCVVKTGKLTPRIVRLGFVNFANIEEFNEAVTVNIAKIHSHPQYFRMHNSIAILELEIEVQFVLGRIMPACIDTDTETTNSNQNYVRTGWSRVNSRGHLSQNLQKTILKIDPIEECRRKFKGFIKIADTHICASEPEMKIDACQGESGQPLNKLIDLDKSLYSIVGVAAREVGCGRLPLIYTKVSAYIDFIENIVFKDSNGFYTI